MMSQILKNLIAMLPLLNAVQGVWAACETEIELAADVRAGIFTNPNTKPAVRAELSQEYSERLRGFDKDLLQAEVEDLKQKISSGLKAGPVIAGHKDAMTGSITYWQAQLCLAKTRLEKSPAGIANRSMACESEIERGIRGDAAGRSKIIDQWKNSLTLSKNQLLQNVETERKNLNDARRYNYPGNAVAYYEMQICVTDAALNGVTPDGSRQNSRAQQSNQAQLGQNQQLQKIDQSTQQQVRESQQLAQQNQTRADKAREGKRKTNDPAAQASNCLEIDKAAALYGGFKNTCEYKVNYVFCNFGPKKDSWADFHNCEKKNGIGAWQVGGGRASAAHTKNTAMVYWFACKDPATPVDSEFVLGKGIEARCHN